MPELPEVETVRRSLWRQLEGRTLVGVNVREGRLRWRVDASALAQHLLRRRVLAVRRRAKYLLVDVAPGAEVRAGKPSVLLVHLGMTGWLGVVGASAAVRAHDHVHFALDDGRLLRYNDARRFGSLHAFGRDAEAGHPLLRHLGPEPLDDGAFDAAYLWQATRGSARCIKAALMDAALVVGVGNIYANEALFLAGIHPRLPAGRLSRARAAQLVAAVRYVLQDAIEVGGTTLRDFSNADGLVGMFAPRLRVYGRGCMACGRCGGQVKKFVLHARSTYACFRCQKR